jgi:hypothetical protein
MLGAKLILLDVDLVVASIHATELIATCRSRHSPDFKWQR